VQLCEFESVVLVPMISEGQVLGLIAAGNKPGGFGESDVQLLSIFAGAAGAFLRSRLVFDRQRRHAARLERLSALAGEMAGARGRQRLIDLATTRIQKDLGFTRVAFHVPDGDALRLVSEAGAGDPPTPTAFERLRWALRSATPLPGPPDGPAAELAVPVRAAEQVLGVLDVVRQPAAPFAEEEVSLLQTVAGQLALALQRADSEAATERMAAQMATLYDLGLQTSALRDLRQLFVKATEESGRLIRADHTSVFRLDESEGVLNLVVAWARNPAEMKAGSHTFRVGEGVAGRVVRDRVPALVNEVAGHPDFVAREHPLARLLCVPLTYYDQKRGALAAFGVLNATRHPGAPPFSPDDLDDLTRFAQQLSIAVANSMAFDAEHERSQQLALVNTLLRAIAGSLSRERILEVAVHKLREAFQYPRVAIFEADPAGLPRLAAQSADAWPEPESALPVDAGLFGRAFSEARTVEDQGRVAVPILSGDEVVAVLAVEGARARAFDREVVITLETLADGIGILLRNAELYGALEETNERLVELDRMKSELVNIVAHDFRAPLTGILSYAELLEWKPDASLTDRVERAQAIIRSATHMAELVDKTLKTTRLETGELPFEFALVDVVGKLREVVSRLPRDPRRPVTVEVPDHPLPVWADGNRLAEVVENLLSNAVKYSPDGGEIRLAGRRERESVVVSVTDRGVGIAAANHEQVFRPYFRVRDARTADIDGSGLGLYICERIVRAHGGRLSLESAPGQGATFRFVLPLFGAAVQEREPLVLVAACDLGTRRDVKRVAEAMGYGTHEVADGVDALEAALRLVPAVVIMDRVLPRLSAEELAFRLKSHAATGDVPLFALATRLELGARAKLFEAFVPQPLDPEHLADALAALGEPGAGP
jgi:signal transduction histidine kinase